MPSSNCIGSVFGDCTEEEEQKNWNTIQWFIRNIYTKADFQTFNNNQCLRNQ